MGISHVAVVGHSVVLMILLTFFFTVPITSSSSIESLVYCGCSQYRYMRGSTYETNVNSMLTSLVNSAISTTSLYNHFTIPAASADTVSGFFQCRGDLSSPDCFNCISTAVTQLGTVCLNSLGGAMQLQGCFIKYDNSSFLGIEDKTILFKKCGSVISRYDSDAIAKRDSVLAYIGSDDGTNKPYRYSSASGGIQGMAQCVQHIDSNKCHDCLTEAIRQLKTTCGAAPGDMFLGTCYVRYSSSNHFSTTPSHTRPSTLLFAFISVILLLASYLI